MSLHDLERELIDLLHRYLQGYTHSEILPTLRDILLLVENAAAADIERISGEIE